MVSGFPAPFCDLCDQRVINPAVRDTDRPLIGLVVLEFLLKV